MLWRVTMTDERYTRTQDVSPGPRRTAVEKADRELEVSTWKMDLALDTRDWVGASEALCEVKTARAMRQRAIDCYVLDLEGAEAFYAPRKE